MRLKLPFKMKVSGNKKDTGDHGEEAPLATTQEREVRHRNKIIGYIIGGLGMLFIAAYIWNAVDLFGGNSQPREKRKEEKMPKNAVQNQVASAERADKDWKTVWEAKFTELQNENKVLKDEVEKNKVAEKAAKEKAETEKSQAKNSYPKGIPPVPTAQKSCSPEVDGASCSQGANAGITSLPGQNYGNGYGQSQQPAKAQQAPISAPSSGFKRFEFKFESKQATSKNTVEELFVPMGFTTGITLTGADAPTFQWGQSDPQPLMASIETDLITSGDGRIPMKGCMVLASTHGAVSSERAMPRLVKMECRDKKGNLYSGNVEGWILGDDGKIGLRGILVSRQGAVLSRAFMASLLDGIASIIRTSATTVAVSPLGSTSTIDTSEAVKAGVAQGASSASEKLSQFYIKIAEQIYPVIEVLPGRKVTVLFKGGQKLAMATKESKGEDTRLAKAETGKEVSKLK